MHDMTRRQCLAQPALLLGGLVCGRRFVAAVDGWASATASPTISLALVLAGCAVWVRRQLVPVSHRVVQGPGRQGRTHRKVGA